MRDVYCATYGDDPSEVKFTLRPTPRIEIGSVEEIVMLLDAGIVSFENAMQISNMLLVSYYSMLYFIFLKKL